MKKVVVFGAGIAGLSVAHEFSKRGYIVHVHEANKESGGFFRSTRRSEDEGMPSEYSWHGIGPWYHNVFLILKEIPDETGQSLYDTGLSRPIDFGMAPDEGTAQFDDSSSWMVDVKKMFRLSTKDKIFWLWILLKVWCARKRSREVYSRIKAIDAWKPYLGEVGLRTWAASFGPWVGSDWQHVSYHQAGHFFRKQLITKPTYVHKGDSEGGPWKHGARSGWLLLNGPSSEVWFTRWVNHLKNKNVTFHWESELHKLIAKDDQIHEAHLKDASVVNADIYVMALNPFSLAEIINQSLGMEGVLDTEKFNSLIQDGPHTQVSFRIAFGEKINWPRKRCAVVIADSEFNITLFAQEQAWRSQYTLGDNVQSLWTATACVSKVPGPLFGKTLEKCTKKEFIEEVLYQLERSSSLGQLIKEANSGRSWKSFKIIRVEVWHEWEFSPGGIRCRFPKWVNTTHTQEFMPEQKTGFSNLVIAGAHTQTHVDVWSIEAAVESGKRAVGLFEDDVVIIPQYEPAMLKMFWMIDDLLYSLRLPNVVDVILTLVTLLVLMIILN